MRVALPLASAVLAAVTAHVLIDVAGDYLLAHDAYDDQGHASRWLASLTFACTVMGTLWLFARTALAETRGERGALKAALRSSLPRSRAAFCALVSVAALPLVAAMAWGDVRCAGVAVDDLGDLLGGSIVLGTGVTLACGIAVSLAVHRVVALVTRFHRSVLNAVSAIVRGRDADEHAVCAVRSACRRNDRPRVPSALVRCACADRAPPRTAIFAQAA